MISFLFISHLYEVIPRQRTSDIIRQQNTVIKRKVFFTEYYYFIFCIQCPVTFYKSASPGSRSYNNNFLPGFLIQFYLYRAEFKIRFLAPGIDQVIGKIIGTVQIIVEYFAPMHRHKHYTGLYTGRKFSL